MSRWFRVSQLKLAVMVPFLGFVLLLAVSVATIEYQKFLRESNRISLEIETAVENSFHASVTTEAAALRAIADTVANDSGLKTAFRQRDRHHILDMTSNLFEGLRETTNLTHFYFIDPARRSILRAHQPDRSGDVISRHTLLAAESRRTSVEGIELGPLGTLTLRVVVPWFDGDELLGYIETGKEIDHLFDGLRYQFNLHTMIFLPKARLDRQGWEEGMAMLGRQALWNEFDDMVLSVRDNIPAELIHSFLVGTSDNLRIGDRWYSWLRLNIPDASGLPAASVGLFRDVTDSHDEIMQMGITIAVIAFLGSAVVIVIFWLVIDRIETTLNRTRDELAQREALYHSLFSGARIVMLLVDPENGAIIDANEEACRFYGYDSAQLRTMRISDINTLSVSEIEGEMARAKAESRTHFHFQHRLASGEIRDVDTHSGPIEVMGRTLLYSIIHDVTDRRRLEAERKRLVMAIEQSPISVVITDPDAHIEYVNPAFTRASGYSREEAIGQNPRFVSSGETPEEEYQAMWEDLSSGKAWTGIFYNKRKNGALYWEQAHISPVSDEYGHVTHFVGIKEDVTDRRRNEMLMAVRLRLTHLASTCSLHDLLVATLDEVCALTGAEIGYYHFLMPDQITLSLQAWSTRTTREFCQALPESHHYPIDAAGIWADAVRQRRTVVYNDYPSLSGRKGYPAGHVPMQRLVSVPIFRGDTIKAVIGVGNKPTLFDDGDQTAIETLADLAWDIVERKQAEERLLEQMRLTHHHYESLRALSDIGALRSSDRSEQITEALTLGCRHLGLPIGIVSQIEGNSYTIAHYHAPEGSPLANGQVFDLGTTYCAMTLQAGDVVAIPHMSQSIHAAHPCYQAFALEAYIGAPVTVRGRRYGTVNFSSPTPYDRPFDEGDLEFMRLLARWVGALLERGMVEQDVRDALAVAEEARRQTNLLLSSAGEGIFGIDTDARLTFVNPAVVSLLGYTDGAALIGQPSHAVTGHSLGDGTACTESQCAVLQTLRDGVSRRSDSDYFCHRDGTSFPIELSVTAITEQGGIIGAVVVFHDISERRSAEHALADAFLRIEGQAKELGLINAELEQFAYVASHDLRQPLRMISSYLSLIRKQMGDQLDNEIGTFFNFAVDGAKRMDSLILGLLDYSRTGRNARPFEPVSLAEVVSESLTNLQFAIQDAQAEIVVEEGLPMVKGDRIDLLRLFQNLIGNAIKYRAPDRPAKIIIGSHRENREELIWVRDNGIGIDPDQHDRAFQIFQRLVPRDAYEGSGLGLAICKKIVGNHDGRIWIESAVGEGSTLLIAFPMVSGGASR